MSVLQRPLRGLSSVLRSSSTRKAPTLLARKYAGYPEVAAELRRTPLYDYHLSNQAKMVPFAGWSMPLSYGDVGQVAAHNHVRTAAGLFDVSHMLQHRFTGPSTQSFLSSLCPSTLDNLAPYSSTYSVLLNDRGGIVDDMIVTKQGTNTDFLLVTNAGRVAEDKAYIQTKLDAWNTLNGDVKWETLDGWGLLALQGPKAGEVLQSMTETDLSRIMFGQCTLVEIGREKVRCHITRTGYTGEDGFEISIPPESTLWLTEEIKLQPQVMLIGLGARDSLRLEAGMCLYGHDLDETISPVEAGLSWIIGKERRSVDAELQFPGHSRIVGELAKGPRRRRVGFAVIGPPAREGCKVFDAEGSQEIGVITSGIPSPTLKTNIAMGYVANGHHKKGTKVMVEVRNKLREAEIKGMPFVPTRYFKGG